MYNYWIVKEDFCTGKQGNHRRRIARNRPLRVGGLYAHIGRGCLGCYRVLELIEEHGDVAAALMVYHGEKGAVDRAERGEISGYARKILELSTLLERNHGK